MTDGVHVIRCGGRTLAELLVNSAKAMSEAMVDGQVVKDSEVFSQVIMVRAVDEESLLVEWLTELQERIYMDNFRITNITIKKCSDTQVSAELAGCYVDSFAQELGEVLLDETTVKQTDKGFEATIVFDE